MTEQNELLRSALHDRHVMLGAAMGEEGGWNVPLSYGSVIGEVQNVRTRAGVTDMSHAGRLRVRGASSVELLERLCTTDVAHMEDNTGTPTLLCNDRGGIIDQCHLLRLDGFWVLITSPIARTKVLEHLQANAAGLDVKVDDQTDKTTMISVTGPAAAKVLDAVLPEKASHLPTGTARTGSLLIAKYIVYISSDSGQWGMNVTVPNMAAGMAWDFITKKAGVNALPPVGLAARDVLRMEAGGLRYGHELNETIDPVTAGLEGLVCVGKTFIGSDAVAACRARGSARKLVGLQMVAQGGASCASGHAEGCNCGAGEAARIIPRQGAAVWSAAGREVGAVTSGTYSPTLDKVIAMAYVSGDCAAAGTEVSVGKGTDRPPAKVCELPFWKSE